MQTSDLGKQELHVTKILNSFGFGCLIEAGSPGYHFIIFTFSQTIFMIIAAFISVCECCLSHVMIYGQQMSYRLQFRKSLFGALLRSFYKLIVCILGYAFRENGQSETCRGPSELQKNHISSFLPFFFHVLLLFSL